MRRYFLLFLVILAASCLPDKAESQKAQIAFNREKIQIISQNQRRLPVELMVEIADTNQKRMHGLMYRTELADDAGMLFLFPSSRRISMWMANTVLSLDMLFIDENGEIKEIIENTVPFSHDEIRSQKSVVSVLEIKAGLSRHYDLRPGDVVAHSFFKLENSK
ncbi:MAG: DUF192 domain-containing protein [Alphaproteobacteria bacterium]|nr:DUF192 domain-containing protein [Alphaproteobacteria bacterium]